MNIKKNINLFGNKNDNDEKDVVFSEKAKRELNQIITELNRYVGMKTVKTDEYRGNKKKHVLYDLWNELLEQVEIYCDVWIEKENLRSGFNRANDVLTAYYENGQILDYLERINIYIDDLTDDEDPALAFKACCNNYIYFLSHFMENMNKEHEKNNTEFDTENSDSVTSIRWIRENEASKLKSVSAFKSKLGSAKTLVDKVSRQTLTTSDEKEYRSLTVFMEEYAQGKTEFELLIEEDIAAVKSDTLQLNGQIKSINEDIKKAETLYTALNNVLSPSWFEQFKINEFTENSNCIELRKFLLNAMDRVNREILKIYSRR